MLSYTCETRSRLLRLDLCLHSATIARLRLHNTERRMAFNQFNSDQELPYAVFDTSTTPNVFSGPARRITWTVNASRHSEPIRLESLPQAIQLSKSPTPWPVFYDHRIRVSVRSFATDIVNSIYGQSGYLEHLQSNAPAKVNFEKCMNYFYPT